MDPRRAQEIISSPVMTEVTYNGKPIYIQSVNEEAGTAKVHPMDKANNIQTVSLSDLIEH